MTDRLTVLYEFDINRIFHRDEEAKIIAEMLGGKCLGSGTGSGWRDIEFEFGSPTAKENAIIEFTASGFRVQDEPPSINGI